MLSGFPGLYPGTEPEGPLVMLVEDVAEVRTLFASTLRAIGFRVIEAAGGLEAVELCDDAALIVTDLEMSEDSGVELIAALRRRRADLPIVALSGNQRLLAAAERSGAEVALQKPFSLSDIERATVKAHAARTPETPIERTANA
jgi:CheY-like chemotaxis protein